MVDQQARAVSGAQSEAASARPAKPTAELTFIGNATTLLRLGEFTVLTDPNFLHRGQRAYLGYGLWSRRLAEPAMQPGELPELDAVVLSHLHGDHFDRIAREQLAHDLPIVTTPAAAGRLRRWGFDAAHPLDPWASTGFARGGQRLELTAVPGVHGPGPIGRRLMPPVMGTVLRLTRPDAAPLTVYVTGDTLPCPGVREVTRRFPDLDAMLIHLGGTRILGITITMNGRQGAELIDALNPPLAVPIHFDDYRVFRSPLSDFLAQVRARRTASEIRVLERGATGSLLPDAPR